MRMVSVIQLCGPNLPILRPYFHSDLLSGLKTISIYIPQRDAIPLLDMVVVRRISECQWKHALFLQVRLVYTSEASRNDGNSP